MIEASNLKKRYGEVVALDGISFSIKSGDICALLGPNGAGKTTTMKILTGLISADSGEAKICNYNIKAEALEAKRCIGYVPENAALYPTLTPREYLTLVCELRQLPVDVMKERVHSILNTLKIDSYADRLISSLSKGMRQKVLIAGGIIHSPQVIFLDEPLSGLDANTAWLVKEAIEKLAEEGRCILYCSHILEVVEVLCQRVIIINKGKIIADSSTRELVEKDKDRTLTHIFKELTTDEDEEEMVSALLASIGGRRNIKKNSTKTKKEK